MALSFHLRSPLDRPLHQRATLPPAVLSLLAAAAGLLTLGLLGIARGDALLGGDRLPRQLVYATVALLAGGVASRLPVELLKTLAPPLLVVSCIGLVAVFGFDARNGSRRWIPLGPIDLQPSELAKLSLVLAVAARLAQSRQTLTLRGVLGTLTMAAGPMLLIIREPDLGTAILFGPTTLAMLLAAGSRRRDLLLVVATAAVLLPLLWLGMSAEQRSRVTTLTGQQDGGRAPQGDGYHLHQSKQVLAIGGAGGIGVDDLLAREPLSYHLPAARTDFVLCLIGQRLGLPGTLGVLACVAVLAMSANAIAAGTRDPFSRLLTVGLATMLVSQAAVNTAMTVGLMPITGVTLPLCSYGGSSMVATAVAIGLLVSVGTHRRYDVAESLFWWE